MKEPKVFLQIGTVIAIITAVLTVAGLHFNGISEATAKANVYTDQKGAEIRQEVKNRLDNIETTQRQIIDIITRH